MDRPTKERLKELLTWALEDPHADAPLGAAQLACEVMALREESTTLQWKARDLESVVGKLDADLSQCRSQLQLMTDAHGATEARIVELRAEMTALNAAATDFVENREEATKGIWYVSGKLGRKLLEVLGIPYVEKE